ncbi:response regulator [Vibrio sp. F13]|uniref:response regulator n=1 Tax=Vibrio sp. F13 TaxID=2070777 RepID=UPI0010BD7121|nr:response regulator [Vibrio sp. F13]TKG09034.1 response regulator [Vibrio sp. F13]
MKVSISDFSARTLLLSGSLLLVSVIISAIIFDSIKSLERLLVQRESYLSEQSLDSQMATETYRLMVYFVNRREISKLKEALLHLDLMIERKENILAGRQLPYLSFNEMRYELTDLEFEYLQKSHQSLVIIRDRLQLTFSRLVQQLPSSWDRDAIFRFKKNAKDWLKYEEYSVKYRVSVNERISTLFRQEMSEYFRFISVLLLITLVVYGLLFYAVFYMSNHLSAPLKKVAKAIQTQNKTAYIDEIEQQLGAMKNQELSLFFYEIRRIGLQNQVLIERLKLKAIKESQARRLEAQSHQEKVMFFSTISHEIRTPLNIVMGLVELLRDDLNDQAREQYVSECQSNVDLLLSVLNNVIDYQKLSSGRLTIRPARFRLEDLVSNVILQVRTTMHEKKLDFLVLVDNGVPTVINEDQYRLNQILINLLFNSLKFTDKGRVTLEIKRQADRLLFCVIDTGIGIEQSNIDMISNPFMQQSTNKVIYASSGLGLAIVNELVEQMKGTLEIKSSVGLGTTCQVSLPLSDEQETSLYHNRWPLDLSRCVFIIDCDIIGDHLVSQYPEIRQHREVSELFVSTEYTGDIWILDDLAVSNQRMKELINIHNPSIFVLSRDPEYSCTGAAMSFDSQVIVYPFNPLSLQWRLESHPPPPITHTQFPIPTDEFEDIDILVAEDVKMNRTIIERLLNKMQLHPRFSENGLEAITAIKRCKPDIVLMDIDMPVMDGIQASKQIRDIYSSEQLPIIALSGNVYEEKVEQCYRVGINDYLLKPFSIEELETALIRSKVFNRKINNKS